MMLAAVETVTKADPVWEARRQNSDATTLRTLVLVLQVAAGVLFAIFGLLNPVAIAIEAIGAILTGSFASLASGVGQMNIAIVAPPSEPLTAGLTGNVLVYSATTEPCPLLPMPNAGMNCPGGSAFTRPEPVRRNRLALSGSPCDRNVMIQ
jgi:hypothetical protein